MTVVGRLPKLISGVHRCLLALVGAALIVASSSAIASDTRRFTLAPGDRLTVTIAAEPQMSGEYTVDNAGEINVPLIGGVTVSGLTVAECERKVSKELANGFLRQPSVSVRVLQLRPIQVLGDVRTPGTYPYLYNGLVKTAVAQAGGYGRSDKSMDVELLTADERLKLLGLKKTRLMIKKARLEAQLQAKSEFDVPTSQFATAADSRRIGSDELQVLGEQVGYFQKQLETLQKSKEQIQIQILKINDQIASERKQVALMEQRIASYSKLAERGLGREATTFDLQISLAAKLTEVGRLEVERSRLQVASIEFDAKRNDAEALYKKGVLAELSDARQLLSDVDIELPSARAQRAARLLSADLARIESNFAIRITRMVGRVVTTINAAAGSPIEPGDIIEITMIPPKVIVGHGEPAVAEPPKNVQ